MASRIPLVLLSLFPTLALSQEQSQALAPIVVSARKESKTLTVPSPEQSREELQKTPGGTEVIESERYLVGRSSTLADTFFLSPGVIAQPRFGADEARISIRGSGLQRTFHGRGIRVLQDGVPINLADGGFDMQSIEPTASHFINVWRGGNALAYGASTLGGAMDYVSHTGHSSPGASLRTEAGSWDYQRTTLTGGWHDQQHDVFSALTYQRQDGFRRNAEQENLRLFQNFGWRIADDVETRFYLTALQTESELPGALTRSQMFADPRQANAINVLRDQRRDYDLARLANKTTIRSGANTLEMFGAVTYKDLDHPIFQVIDQVSRDYLWGANITHQATIFGRENRIKSGVMITHGETNAAQLCYASPTSSRRGSLISDDDQVATNLEAFVEDQYELALGWTGVIGGMVSHNKRKNTRRFGTTTAATNYDLSFHELAPKLGMRWDGIVMQFFANVSGSYEPPSFSEAITSNIARRAQTALTYEMGTRGAKEFFRWDLALYHSEIQDELLAVLDPLSNLSTTTNANETTHSGVELGAEIDLLGQDWETVAEHRLVWSTAWTYGRFKFKNHRSAGYDYAGNTIAGLPPHLVRSELMWRHASGWYAGPIAEWVPQGSFIDHRNTLKADPYALLGFRFGRRVPDGISWFVEARNLTDKVHAATTGVIDNANGLDVAQFLPGDGLGAFCGMEVQW